MKSKHILVLCGGKSTEREVSLRSGAAVSKALEEAGFRVTVLDPSKENLASVVNLDIDCAFIALHGIGGEDGSIQGFLEWMDIPYTGPGVEACALCLDKIMTKKVLSYSGIPTPRFLEVSRNVSREEEADRLVTELGIPLVLKACRQGSSIGTAIVRKREDCASALEEISAYGDNVLAEAFLSGKELTVPIMGNGDPAVLPIIEITSEGEYYDYHSKYTPGQSHHIIPARLTEKEAEEVGKIAKMAYMATGCRGYARVDVMLTENGEPQVIEINTAPGMTATSLFPDAAAAVGKSFPQLVTEIVTLALEK